MSDTEQWVFFFGEGSSEGDPQRKDILGGKGASLAEMSRAGLPVPPGFTISAECCKYFFEHDNTWPSELEQQVKDNLARLENVTGRKFGEESSPLFVSVRSGAAQSMPGMMDTILNCGIHPKLAEKIGDMPEFWHVYIQFVEMFSKVVADIPTEEFKSLISDRAPCSETAEACLTFYKEKTGKAFPDTPWDMLTECINAVFGSWNNERAVTYREQRDIRGLLGTAVNVQSMFPSHISGILFTQDPNNLAAGQMVIESAYGLGESVVSGDVDPDRFIVKRDDFSSVETYTGKKTAMVAALGDDEPYDPETITLTPDQINELCTIGIDIEKHFDMPMDIEWGIAEGNFGLLQCRKIRGLEIAEDVEKGRQEEIERLKSESWEKRRVWVEHNLGETLPAPTPLTWDITRKFMSGSGGFGLLYQDLGYAPSQKVMEDGFLDLICGRIYADTDRAAQLFWDEGIPFAYELEDVLEDKSVLESAPLTFDADKTDPAFLIKVPGMILSLIKSSRMMKRLRKTIKDIFENEILPDYLSYIKTKRDKDLSSMSTAELIDELKELNERVMNQFGKESLKPGFFGGVALAGLETMLVQLMGEEKGSEFARTLVMGLDGDITVHQNIVLEKVARNEASMEEFLEQFGHWAVGEMEFAEPRWREDTSYVEQMISGIRSSDRVSPEDIHQKNKKKREEAEKSLDEVLGQWGGTCFREDILHDLKDAQKLLPYRETGKHYLMMGYELIRNAIMELSRRWDLGKGVFYLHFDELERFENEREVLLKEIEQRKVRWQSAKRLDLTDVIDSDNLDDLGIPQEFEAATEFSGDGVASGMSTGTARIVFDPREAGDLGTGYVLVCPSTDPGWTSLFVNAKGLVVERGGILSHGAIVARDFGIPAVVCPNATSRIKDGDRIRVDGNKGYITVIEESEEHA